MLDENCDINATQSGINNYLYRWCFAKLIGITNTVSSTDADCVLSEVLPSELVISIYLFLSYLLYGK